MGAIASGLRVDRWRFSGVPADPRLLDDTDRRIDDWSGYPTHPSRYGVGFGGRTALVGREAPMNPEPGGDLRH